MVALVAWAVCGTSGDNVASKTATKSADFMLSPCDSLSLLPSGQCATSDQLSLEI